MVTEKVYVNLLEEGSPTARPTQAENLGNNTYKILPTPDYNAEDEKWEFIPGSIVRCVLSDSSVGKVLYAVESVLVHQ